MQGNDGQRLRPELRELAIEASLALARLDAERLEELALSCQALEYDSAHDSPAERKELAGEARAAMEDIAVFGGVLEATGANLDVLRSVCERGPGHPEYAEYLVKKSVQPWALMG